jgi:hypothetical protein
MALNHTCQHCGSTFPGRRRKWCQTCAPKIDESCCSSGFGRTYGHLGEFMRTGVHMRCCGWEPVTLRAARCMNCDRFVYGKRSPASCDSCSGATPRDCNDCGVRYTPSSLSNNSKTYCRRCISMRRKWSKAYGGAYRSPFRADIECGWCFSTFSAAPGSGRFCPPCRGKAKEHYARWKAVDRCQIPQCFDCSRLVPYVAMNGGDSILRCADCSSAGKKESEVRRRRAVVDGDKSINWRSLGERDGWTCHLCGGAVPQIAGTAHQPQGATVDHLVPIADNGDHQWDNVALAHRRCNISRGTRGLVQLRLVG